MGIEGIVVLSIILGYSDMLFSLFLHLEITCCLMCDAWGVRRSNCTRRSGDDLVFIFKPRPEVPRTAGNETRLVPMFRQSNRIIAVIESESNRSQNVN